MDHASEGFLFERPSLSVYVHTRLFDALPEENNSGGYDKLQNIAGL